MIRIRVTIDAENDGAMNRPLREETRVMDWPAIRSGGNDIIEARVLGDQIAHNIDLLKNGMQRKKA